MPTSRVPERLLTPSAITAWLDCAHFLSLKHQVEAGEIARPAVGMGSFAELLMAKGLQHEQACLADYEARGLRVLYVPQRYERETFAAWTRRIGNPLDSDADVIFQMPFVHDGIRGIADFLERHVDEDGVVTWEPLDAKLARNEAKPGHVLQLCFYADAIAALTGRRPARMHVWLGSGKREPLEVREFAPYWRRLRAQLVRVLDAPVALATTPEPCDHCAFCDFSPVCEQQWRDADALPFVAGLRAPERTDLQLEGVGTLAKLASRTDPVPALRPERQARLVQQAALQVQAREQQQARPPFVVVPPSDDPVFGQGFSQLPEPDDGDVFLDFEGHPFWRADRGLFFLFGLIEKRDGVWHYRSWEAHCVACERAAVRKLVEHLAARRAAHPGMHVYHYNHTERSALQSLAAEHRVGQPELAELVSTGAFVDLLLVARNAVQVGTESYGLKALERLTDYERSHDIDAGAGAVLEYEAYMAGAGRPAMTRIAAYNEDDVRATRALRDWLVDHRPADLPWRPAVLEGDEEPPELDEQVARLHAYGEGTPEHLLGDVLGYWRREWSAHLAPLRARCDGDTDDLLEDPEAVTGLVFQSAVARQGKNGKELRPTMRFAFPPQDVSGWRTGDQLVFSDPGHGVGYSGVHALDADAGLVELSWSEPCEESGHLPQVVVRNGWVSPKPKPEALSAFAANVLDGSATVKDRVALALLRRKLPRFAPGGGPTGGVFSDDLDEMLAWATQLDGSYVAVQGPPGTGKTFRGAHLVRALVAAGKRVGITAMSHHAIDNLVEAVVALHRELGEDVPAIAKKTKGAGHAAPDGATAVTTGKAAARGAFNVVAGTTWLFAGKDMADAPVDVLLVDEAGQLSLADVLAACRSAGSVVLLGDPLQLPQVSHAAHPNGAGASVLEHVLGDAVTMPPERGVFLSETRRMHPDVCTFISEEIYEGRLTSHESCSGQGTAFGTGLRWLRAVHAGRVTHAEEEAALVVDEIVRLLGTSWTDQHGHTRPLTTADVLVVAPYNDQVDLLRARLDEHDDTRGVAVGTVDKFQGRQAAVVFFTMTTSTAADMHRSADFLFSRNRFNVAISRARCLAYLVCTEDLLNSRAGSVDDMRLMSTVCAFVERTAPAHLPAQRLAVEPALEH